MNTTTICFKLINPIKMKTTQLILLLLLCARTTNEATSNSSTANKNIAPTNTNKIALSFEAITSPPTTKANYHLSKQYVWGHNTKYATIIFNENIIVKGFTLLNVQYSSHDDSYNDYTIIGIYAFAIDEFHSNVTESVENDVTVFIEEGGVGRKFAKVRFESKTLNDVEFNLKIFGINV